MIATPHPPDDSHHIFTEGIDYSQTGDESIWGSEDHITVTTIEDLPKGGRWLDVCAGDGRFSARLLEKADAVVAFDIDASALEKLERLTPSRIRNKLTLTTGNVTERFPFSDKSFDGIFCTGNSSPLSCIPFTNHHARNGSNPQVRWTSDS